MEKCVDIIGLLVNVDGPFEVGDKLIADKILFCDFFWKLSGNTLEKAKSTIHSVLGITHAE